MGDDKFVEVYVEAPLATTEARDVKGLYKKARSGLLKNFTDIDSPYEIPAAPKVRLHTERDSPEECAEQVVAYLREKGFI